MRTSKMAASVSVNAIKDYITGFDDSALKQICQRKSGHSLESVLNGKNDKCWFNFVLIPTVHDKHFSPHPLILYGYKY